MLEEADVRRGAVVEQREVAQASDGTNDRLVGEREPALAHERLLDAARRAASRRSSRPSATWTARSPLAKTRRRPRAPSPASSASSSAPVAEGRPSSSAVTPCTTSAATSLILNPCEYEKDQNFKSSSPWLGPCSSSLSASCFRCSGLMCVYRCLHASRMPRCASNECSDARPTPRHVCIRVATHPECSIASYRDQWRSSVKRNSSLYCTRRSSNARDDGTSSSTRLVGASAPGRLLTCVASSITPAV